MKPITTDADLAAAGGTRYVLPVQGAGRRNELNVLEFDAISDMASLDFSQFGPGKRFKDRNTFTFGSFRNYNTYETAQRALLDGHCPEEVAELYQQMRDAMAHAIEDIAATMVTTKRKRRYDIDGDEVSIERVMTQSDEPWERRVRGAKKRSIKIAVNSSYSAGTDQRAFIEGVVRGIALSDILTRLGYGVEIISARFASNDEGKHFVVLGGMKASNEPLDPERLLSVVLPCLQRLFQWGALEIYGRNMVQDTSLGPERPTQSMLDAFDIDVYSTSRALVCHKDDADNQLTDIIAAVDAISLTSFDAASTKAINDKLESFKQNRPPSN